jgi:hypothetical protein
MNIYTNTHIHALEYIHKYTHTHINTGEKESDMEGGGEGGDGLMFYGHIHLLVHLLDRLVLKYLTLGIKISKLMA